MSNDPRKKASQTPSWKGGAKSSAPTGPSYSWRKENTAPPGSTSRRVKQAAFGLGVLATAVAIVIYILYLMAPPQPGFVAVGADPKEDASRLFVPLDLYGWSGGTQMLNYFKSLDNGTGSKYWGRQLPKAHSDMPVGIPEDPEQLQNWANGFAKYEPIIIYFGMHGGGDVKGPYLFSGNGKAENSSTGKPLEPGEARRIYVSELLAVFKTPALAKKPKIFIFDPGRLNPDPMYGILQDDFATKLKAIEPEVSAVPNLIVICGAAPGQRAWESEELRSTPVAQAVLETLRGEELNLPVGRRVDGIDFFQAVQKKVREWTSRNRPTQQEPFLLPSGETGEKRAKEISVTQIEDMAKVTSQAARVAFETGEAPKEAPKPVILDEKLKDLAALWQQHDALAKSRPSPASYAPRLWRTYRELLLRYELAVRSGEPSATAKLQADLSGLQTQVNEATQVMAKATSKFNSVAMWTALNGRPPARPSNLDLQLTTATPLAAGEEERAGLGLGAVESLMNNPAVAQGKADQFGTVLRQASNLLKQMSPDRRPSEVHLAVMVDHFYQDLKKPLKPQPVVATGVKPVNAVSVFWAKVIGLKRLAELASVGLGDPKVPPKSFRGATPPEGYSERVWPLIQKPITEADKLRRQVEDQAFIGNDALTPDLEALIAQATKLYLEASELATHARVAWDIRDHLYADLPFFALWAMEQSPSRVQPGNVLKLWADLHKLSQKMQDALGLPTAWQEIRGSAEQLAEAYEKEFDKFRKELLIQSTNATDQDRWEKIQILLRVPLIPAADRLRLVEFSREISSKLEKKKTDAGTATGANKTSDELKQLLKNRIDFTIATFNPFAMDFEGLADNYRIQVLKDQAEALHSLTDPKVQEERRMNLASNLTVQFRRLAQFNLLVPKPTGQNIDERGELCSRVAVAFEPDTKWEREQAALNSRRRWRDLLEGLARRVAYDHWYDEKYNPDSAITGDTTGRYFLGQANRYLDDARALNSSLVIVISDSTQRPAAYKVPADLDDLLKVAPLTCVNRSNPPEAILWTSELERQVRFSVFGRTDTSILGTGVSLLQPAEKSLFEVINPKTALDTILVGTAAELQVSARYKLSKPGEQNADGVAETLFYFRGQTPRCSIPLVLQSRPYLIVTNPLPDPNQPTYVAVRAERNLPRGPIAVLIDMSGSMRENLKGETLPEKSWKTDANSKFRIAVDTLKSTLAELTDGTPITIRAFSHDGYKDASEQIYSGKVTWERNPAQLSDLMTRIESLEPKWFTPLIKSIGDSLKSDFKDLDKSGSCLLLLTDGVEQYDIGGLTKAQIIQKRDQELTPMFTAGGPGVAVTLQVVNLGLQGNPKDQELSEALFEKIANHTTPGQVWDVSDRGRLGKILSAAISAKLVLKDPATGLPPGKFPAGGWPSVMKRKDTVQTVRDDLRYSMSIGNYELSATASLAQTPSNYKLAPSTGDHLLVLLARGENNRIDIRRDLYGDFYAPAEKKTYKNKNWVLTVPDAIDDRARSTPILKTFASVEKIPDYRRDGEPRSDDSSTTIQHIIPTLMWWDVRPVKFNNNTSSWDSENLRNETVTRIQRSYGRYAPSWLVEVDNWPLKDSKSQPGRINLWVSEQAPNRTSVEMTAEENKDQTVDLAPAPFKVRVTIEMHRPDGASKDSPEQRCLVVRCQHQYGNPVYVRLKGTGSNKNSQHFYYGKNALDVPLPALGKTKPAYTAYFWPIENAEENRAFNFEWFTLDQVRKPENVLQLDLMNAVRNASQTLDEVPTPNMEYVPRSKDSN
jgi:hypothetical protein